ncbi:hypothetical protein O3M35_001203 [Rhynocoris fuscipes]|uniref:Uncharacterized protein n=1 Tax=Rhynocoris fuscipes TaxID=488301 RepID=A0AAW1DRE7_9HEMI
MSDRINKESSPMDLVLNLCKQISKVAVIYLFGYYNISIAWLLGPIVFWFFQEKWKNDKQLLRESGKAAALIHEKELILAKLDELPAWVVFPDVERVEWLNKIVNQVWPNINRYGNVLSKAIQKSFKKSKIIIEHVRVGTISPRIEGVKVYDKNVARNELIIDLNISYVGDCHIAFTFGGFSGGLKDFTVQGTLRVVLKPLIDTVPFVGGLQLYFLKKPTVDFGVDGVADLLDIGGLSERFKEKLMKKVSSMMVLPNKLSINIHHSVPTRIMRFPDPQGVLRVHVVEAKELMKKDVGMFGQGKSDPYAIISLDSKQISLTKTINNTLNPKWDYWCEFFVEAESGQYLTVFVFDKDKTGKDDSLGSTKIEVHYVMEKGEVDTWIPLKEATTGMIHLRMTWLQFSDNISDLKAALLETELLKTPLNTCILMVFVDSAENLPHVYGKTGPIQPDPLFEIRVGRTDYKSDVKIDTDSPVYEKGFIFLVRNPELDSLHLKLTDKKTGSDLGNITYHLCNLLSEENLELLDHPLHVMNANIDTKMVMSMRLRILKYCGVSTKNDEELPDEEHIAPLFDHRRESNSQNQRRTSTKSAKSLEKEDTEVKSLNLEESVGKSQNSPTLESPSVLSSTAIEQNQRNENTMHSADHFLGRIQLTMRYSAPRQRLIIIVHRIENLPLRDPHNIPDPFVKLYLLPGRFKDSKRKTSTIKDNCNPVYDESFEYIMSPTELSIRQLEVTVLTHKTWKSPVMGQAIINLAEMDLSKGKTAWYDLQPEPQLEKEH